MSESEAGGTATAQNSEGPLADLTGFQRDVLTVISELGEPHGLKVKSELEADWEEEINHGRLYPNLDELQEKGLLEKGELDKRTNFYTLSQRGKRELKADLSWRQQRID